MTRRNDKRNNNPELPEFASMLFGALLGKGVDMIAKKMAENAEEETPDIHAEGISNQDVTNINNGKASLTKCTIPKDGTAVELPIPDNLQVFISEDGKPMIRKKIEGDEKKNHDVGNGVREAIRQPITYDDICKDLFYNKDTYYLAERNNISSWVMTSSNYKDFDNCTSIAQVKRIIAFNKLMNIAKYLNGDWKPSFDRDDEKWNINKEGDTYIEMYTRTLNKSGVYFKSQELTKEAIRLMGEESLNDLFSTDW
jgi:hypothetical protein